MRSLDRRKQPRIQNFEVCSWWCWPLSQLHLPSSITTSGDGDATARNDRVAMSSTSSSAFPSGVELDPSQPGSLFRCGDTVLGWASVTDAVTMNVRRVLRVEPVQAPPSSSIPSMSISAAFVDDNYCDCPDGSDEPFSSACSSGGQDLAFDDSRAGASHFPPLIGAECKLKGSVQRGLDPFQQSRSLNPSRIHDNVVDCCDASDEALDLATLRAHSSTGSSSQGQGCTADRAAFGGTLQRLHQRYTQIGNKEFQRRALHGSTVFRGQFEQNFTREATQFQEWSTQYEAFMASLQARIKAQQRHEQQQAAAAAGDNAAGVAAFLARLRQKQQQASDAIDSDDADEGKAATPPTPITQQEMQHAQQLRQYEQQRSAELRGRQALIQSRGLGRFSEYFPLYGKCFNFTIHEKQLKGGSANPEQYNAFFRVCPFISIMQRTETPEVLAALEALASSAPALQQLQAQEQALSAAIPEGEAAQPFQDCTIVDGQGVPTSPLCRQRQEIATLRASVQRDQETSKYTVVGQWSGFIPDAFENITALDILERFRRRVAPEVAAAVPKESPFIVHQYTNGEPCWNGPARSVALVFECDTVDRVLRIVENGMCRYEVLFGSPSACSDEIAKLVSSRIDAARKQR